MKPVTDGKEYACAGGSLAPSDRNVVLSKLLNGPVKKVEEKVEAPAVQPTRESTGKPTAAQIKAAMLIIEAAGESTESCRASSVKSNVSNVPKTDENPVSMFEQVIKNREAQEDKKNEALEEVREKYKKDINLNLIHDLLS